jgi:hypothetical protein
MVHVRGLIGERVVRCVSVRVNRWEGPGPAVAGGSWERRSWRCQGLTDTPLLPAKPCPSRPQSGSEIGIRGSAVSRRLAVGV